MFFVIKRRWTKFLFLFLNETRDGTRPFFLGTREQLCTFFVVGREGWNFGRLRAGQTRARESFRWTVETPGDCRETAFWKRNVKTSSRSPVLFWSQTNARATRTHTHTPEYSSRQERNATKYARRSSTKQCAPTRY